MHSQTIQTRISDFHKMTLTQMKFRYNKLPPKTIIYRDYKSFNKDAFEEELNFALQAANSQSACATFCLSSHTLLISMPLLRKERSEATKYPL